MIRGTKEAKRHMPHWVLFQGSGHGPTTCHHRNTTWLYGKRQRGEGRAWPHYSIALSLSAHQTVMPDLCRMGRRAQGVAWQATCVFRVHAQPHQLRDLGRTAASALGRQSGPRPRCRSSTAPPIGPCSPSLNLTLTAHPVVVIRRKAS